MTLTSSPVSSSFPTSRCQRSYFFYPFCHCLFLILFGKEHESKTICLSYLSLYFYANIARIVCLQSFSCLHWGYRHTAGCAQLCMGCGNSNSVPHTSKASIFFLAKLSSLASSRPCQPFSVCTTYQKGWLPRQLSHSSGCFTPHLHIPLPSPALVLLTVLCDSAGPYPIVLCLPLPVCFPLCPASFPGCRGPREADRERGICIPLPGAVQISPAILLTNSYQRCPWRTLWRLCSLLLALNRLALHSAWLVHTDS